MLHNTGTFSSSGDNLYYQSWQPENGMKAVVVILHGGGDHSGRFTNVVSRLIPAGYGVFIFDLRGHGRSPGKRGHINSWALYRHDLSAFLDFVQQQVPASPRILFGHSMGGAIVLDYCLRVEARVHAVVVTSPAIGKLGISPFLFQLARILDKVWPSLVLPTGLVVPHLSRDEDFIRETQADPLYHSRSTPRFGVEMVKVVESIHADASNFSYPLYLIHGSDDRIASIEGSRNFARKVDPERVTFKSYEGGYHELFNDKIKDQVLAELLHWINMTLNPP